MFFFCFLLLLFFILSKLAGLGNLGNTRSKLSLKCETTLEIGRLAYRGSYPTDYVAVLSDRNSIIGLSFLPVSADSIGLFSDAFGPREEKLNGKQTKFSGKKSPNLTLL